MHEFVESDGAAYNHVGLKFHAHPAHVIELLANDVLGQAELRNAVDEHSAELMQRFDVRPPSPDQRSASFSGGNQQKLVLAREMERVPRILLVGVPMRCS